MRRVMRPAVTCIMIVLLLILCSTYSLAASSGGFEYDVLADGTAKITRYNGNAQSVEIPAKLDGHIVSEIGDWAFEAKSLTTLTASGDLESLSIGSYAFYNCDQLQTVTINNAVVKISAEAFSGCDNLTTVVISTDSISDWAFENCTSLETVTIPAGVSGVSIGSYAFYHCTNLKNVSSACPVAVQSEAFSGCTGLETVNFPVTTIADWAFEKCTGIKSVVLPYVDGTISIGSYAFYECTGIETFVSVESPTQIGSEAFSGCTGLTSVTLYADSIDDWAFEKCTKLSQFVILDKGTKVNLGDYAFYNCSKLKTAVLPSCVTSIGYSTFESCKKNVILYVAPGSAAESFAKKNNLKYADISSFTEEVPTSSANTSVISPTAAPQPVQADGWTCTNCGAEATGKFCSNCGTAKPVQESTNWTCENCGSEASGNFCSNCGSKQPALQESSPVMTASPVPSASPTPTPTSAPTQATISGNVQVSGDFSYVLVNGGVQITSYNGNSSRVTISSELAGKNVVSIGPSAFQNCTSIETITIWADLTSIGDYAFAGCTALQKFSVPGTTTEIGAHAFEGCYSMESITIWGEPIAINEATFKDCTKLKKISIPSSATFIAADAFKNCTALESATIWGDITSIGVSAFEGCVSLKKISIPSSTKVIGDAAFRGCVSLATATIWGDTNIGHYAFQGCTSLQKISVSSSTEYIGNYAFDGCSSLATVTMWGRNTSIGVGAFDNCPTLSKKPQYPVGQVPADTAIQASSTISGSQATVIPTSAAPSPTPTFTPKPTATPNYVAPASIGENAKRLSSGSYTVGIDLPAGTYHFTQIAGDNYTAIIYVYDANNLSEYVSSGSADATGCVLSVKNGQILKITWTSVDASVFDANWSDDAARVLPSGSYIVGEDIPEGSYHFWQINGDRYTSVIYVFDADNLDEYVMSGSADENGCVLSIKEGQILRLTWTGANTEKFTFSLSDNEERLLPSGTYVIGDTLPAGTYHFKQIDGDRYTAVLYVYDVSNPEEEVASASASEIGCVLSVTDGQILKITWTGVNTSQFAPEWHNGDANVLPSGVYTVGKDIPAGRYTFTKIQGDRYTAVLYVFDDSDSGNEVDSGSANQRGYSVTLKNGQILKITWTGVDAIIENMVPLN